VSLSEIAAARAAERATAPSSVAGASQAENKLVLWHIYTATGALALGAFFGLLQGFSRANFIVMPAWFDYYRMLTAHGVLMALVFTTFFITGLCTFATYRRIIRENRSLRLAWISYAVMLLGTVMTALTILSGNASVLYTFYAPLKASPWFYFGATILIIGTWGVAADILENVVWFKRRNPKDRIPLPAFMAATTFIMWIIATLGVVAEMYLLIPWALGWTPGVDVELTRMLFWYFGHPLVYFWIMGAYIIWYTVVPTTFGGRIFSDALTRLAFILLLLFSTPVGIHHQFVDPGISAGWKWLHMLLTYGVVIPSFMTAFAIFATFELAARRAGVRGFRKTIGWLPWGDPVFAGSAFAMLLFIPGGFGGIVNSSYSMDVLVHNTMWIVGHFHITVGGPVALTFIAATYRLVPALTGRRLIAPEVALAQVWMWFIGMTVMSLSMHWAGLLGAPRRTSDVTYLGVAAAQNWHLEMVLAGIGGLLLFVSTCMFVYVAVGTLVTNERAVEPVEFRFAPVDEEAMNSPAIFDRLGSWGGVAIALAILAYAGPIHEQLSQHHFLAAGMRTW
jgi:cytochrome c oxidase subunit 1